MQTTYLYIPSKINYDVVDTKNDAIVRPISEFNLRFLNNTTYRFLITDNNINITYSSEGIYLEMDEYIKLMDGFDKMKDDDINYYYNEYLKNIVQDNADEEQIVSNDYIYNIYLKNKHLFNNILNKVLLTNNINLYNDVLRSLIFTDIKFDNDKIIKMMRKCIESSENYAISRVITILEILKDDVIINKFRDVKLKSKSLSKRLNNLL